MLSVHRVCVLWNSSFGWFTQLELIINYAVSNQNLCRPRDTFHSCTLCTCSDSLRMCNMGRGKIRGEIYQLTLYSVLVTSISTDSFLYRDSPCRDLSLNPWWLMIGPKGSHVRIVVLFFGKLCRRKTAIVYARVVTNSFESEKTVLYTLCDCVVLF